MMAAVGASSAAGRGTIREGSGEPLVLLHGITSSAHIWRDVIPLLAPSFDTIATTALAHRGGAPVARQPVLMRDVIDDAERQLDELGLDRPHLAGNSMGGWAAIELARRGRARSVCALSPAGMWEPGSAEMHRVYAVLEEAARDARRSRRVMPLLARSARVRRQASRLVSIDGARIPAADMLTRIDEMLACEITPERSEANEALESLDPVPCPVTVAWAEADRLFPPPRYLPQARRLLPGADLLVLGGVGHVPMGDDPGLVARLIGAVAEGKASPPPAGSAWRVLEQVPA